MALPKNYNEFSKTLNKENPDLKWSEALKAMWFDAKENWEASHDIAQEMHNTMGSWMHAYLHRKEGDDWNAGYWYRQAGRPFPKTTLVEEHQEMVEFILNQ